MHGFAVVSLGPSLVAALGLRRSGRRRPGRAHGAERLPRQGDRREPPRLLARRASTSPRSRPQDGHDRVVGTAAQVGAAKFGARKLTTYAPQAAAQDRAQRRRSYDTAGRTRPHFTSDDVDTRPRRHATRAVHEEYDAPRRRAPEHRQARASSAPINGKPTSSPANHARRDASRTNPDGSRPAVLYIVDAARSRVDHGRADVPASRTSSSTTTARPAPRGHPGPRHRRSAATRSRTSSTRASSGSSAVANPDGYDFTFTPGNRLVAQEPARQRRRRRRSTATTASTPTATSPSHWGLDNEGSSERPTTETYRGTGPASEPETQAMAGAASSASTSSSTSTTTRPPSCCSTAPGFQVQTDPEDDPIYRALAGTDADPAIAGNPPGAPDYYDPDVSSELYTTNGDTDETAHAHAAARCRSRRRWTSPTRPAAAALGLRLPGLRGRPRAGVREEHPVRARRREVRGRPGRTRSRTSAATADDFEICTRSPCPTATRSTVRVNAKRALGAVTLHWKVNAGAEHTAPTDAVRRRRALRRRPRRLLPRHARRGHGHERRRRTSRSGSTAGGKTSAVLRLQPCAPTRGRKVLILAAEDYSGKPGARPSSRLREPHGAELPAVLQGRAGRGRHPLRRLRRRRREPHARPIRWASSRTTPRSSGTPATTCSSAPPACPAAPASASSPTTRSSPSATTSTTAASCSTPGQNAAFAQVNAFPFNPLGRAAVLRRRDAGQHAGLHRRCPMTSCSTGSARTSHIDAAADKAGASALPFGGTVDPSAARLRRQRRGLGRQPGRTRTRCVTTSSVLPQAQFPQFAPTREVPLEPAAVVRPAHRHALRRRRRATTTAYQRAAPDDRPDRQDDRPTCSSRCPTTPSPTTTTSSSRPTTSAMDDWTTLARRQRPHVRRRRPVVRHQLGHAAPVPRPLPDQHRQDQTAGDEDCTPDRHDRHVERAPPATPAATRTGSVDLSAYAGSQVEVSITYAQDFATAGLGVFVDDAKVVERTARRHSTDRRSRTGLGGFTAGPPPGRLGGSARSRHGPRARRVGFVDGPGVRRPLGLLGLRLRGRHRRREAHGLMPARGPSRRAGDPPPPPPALPRKPSLNAPHHRRSRATGRRPPPPPPPGPPPPGPPPVRHRHRRAPAASRSAAQSASLNVAQTPSAARRWTSAPRDDELQALVNKWHHWRVAAERRRAPVRNARRLAGRSGSARRTLDGRRPARKSFHDIVATLTGGPAKIRRRAVATAPGSTASAIRPRRRRSIKLSGDHGDRQGPATPLRVSRRTAGRLRRRTLRAAAAGADARLSLAAPPPRSCLRRVRLVSGRSSRRCGARSAALRLQIRRRCRSAAREWPLGRLLGRAVGRALVFQPLRSGLSAVHPSPWVLQCRTRIVCIALLLCESSQSPAGVRRQVPRNPSHEAFHSHAPPREVTARTVGGDLQRGLAGPASRRFRRDPDHPGRP